MPIALLSKKGPLLNKACAKEIKGIRNRIVSIERRTLKYQCKDYFVLFMFFCIIFLSACGQSPTYNVDGSTATSSSLTLSSLTLYSAGTTTSVGTSQQFTALGTYSDNSTQNLTSSVTWTSSSTAQATISSAGLATGVAAGTTNITANLGSVTSAAIVLAVSGATPTLSSIVITPSLPTLVIGKTQQFIATGIYVDSSIATITASVSWASSTPTVATISSSGLATGIGSGTSVITATYNSISSNSVTLTGRAAYAYGFISSSSANRITACNIVYGSGTVSFNNCAQTATTTLSSPYTSAAIASGSNNYFYVVNAGSTKISQCTLNLGSPPTLTACQTASNGTPTGNPYGMAINDSYMYVNDNSGKIDTCPMSLPGSPNVGACAANAATNGILFPGGIALTANYLYVSSLNTTHAINYCAYNSSTGVVSSCNSTGFSYNASSSLSLVVNGNYLYGADSGVHSLFYCFINYDGSLSSCSYTGGGNVFNANGPNHGMTTDGTYVYATIAATNTVYYCPIQSNGSLGTCTSVAAANVSGPVGLSLY